MCKRYDYDDLDYDSYYELEELEEIGEWYSFDDEEIDRHE